MADLVAACRTLLSHRIGDLPGQGWIKDTDESRAALAEVAAAVAEIDAFQAAEAERQQEETDPKLALKVVIYILGLFVLTLVVIAAAIYFRQWAD